MDFQFRAPPQADGDRALADPSSKRRALDGRWMSREDGWTMPHSLGPFKAESLKTVTQSRLRGGRTTADEAFHADLTAGRRAAA